MKNVSNGKREYRVVAAGQFKATCLRLLDEVYENKHLVIIVTKRSKPIGQLIAPPEGLALGGPTVHIDEDAVADTQAAFERYLEKQKKKSKNKKRKL